MKCVHFRKRLIAITSAVCLSGVLLTHSAFAAMFSASSQLGSAADYVVLGIGNPTASTPRSQFQFYQSGTVADGNVGVGPNTTWTHGMDATITGRLDNDPSSVPLPIITGTIAGGVNITPMTSVVNDAIAASTFYAGLTPNRGSFVGLANIPGQTLVGNGGLNVINITGNVAFKTTFTLMGGPNDVFVFQYTSTLKDPLVLSGANIVLNGVSTDNIIWVLNGTGGDVTVSSSANVFGTILAPFRNITVDNATVTGRVIGGGNGALLSIHSSSQILVPEPSTIMAAALLLIPFGASALRIVRKQ